MPENGPYESSERRFLAPINKPRDYVDNPALAVPGEPECIGPAIVDGYTELARFHETQQHQAAVLAARVTRPLLKPEDRLKDAERRAKHAHRKDLTGEFLALRHILARDRQGGRHPSPATLARLERAEAELDGLPDIF